MLEVVSVCASTIKLKVNRVRVCALPAQVWQGGDLLHILVTDFKVKELGVLDHPFLVD